MRKILIVDDDQVIADMYATRFRQDGFEVETAGDSKTAVQKTKEWSPDVILLDLVMYPVDGYETLSLIKKLKLPKSPQVILLSNLGQKEDIDRGMALGAADYIVKANLTPSQVLQKVEKIIKA